MKSNPFIAIRHDTVAALGGRLISRSRVTAGTRKATPSLC